MSASTSAAATRTLAQLSVLVAIANVLATVWALVLLPNAATTGQWLVLAAGVAVSASLFAFGVMTSLRSRRARVAGFVGIGWAIPATALFGLLAYVVPESRGFFGAWTAALLAWAAAATRRLVHWPAGDLTDLPKSTLAIFISYRREDSRETVGRIHDHLRQAFEEDRLFLDVDRQAAGEDYRAVIDRALAHADVLLMVIGPRWLSATDREGRRRLDDPGDMVRLELETAVQRHLRVVPVLTEGASMPRPRDVPPSLQPLCYRSALVVRPDPDFKTDVRRLMLALRGSEEQASGAPAISA